MKLKFAGIAAGLCVVAFASVAHAAGMLPESTVVLINEADGEASMNVKNTDPGPSLLYSTIQPLPEDKDPPVVLTPPVARVESGKTQLVRFMLTNKEPLTVERLARVTFDGIPEKKEDGKNKVTLTVRQNLPVLLHPKSLAVDNQPWKRVKWLRDGDTLTAFNDSPYVVRLDQQLKLMPGDVEASLPKTYLVPGQRVAVALPKPADAASAKAATDQKAGADAQAIVTKARAATRVVLTPFTTYGYAAAPYDAPVVPGADAVHADNAAPPAAK